MEGTCEGEIRAAERAFCAAAAAEGVAAAFLRFAAEDAVICRNGRIHAGKGGIAAYFRADPMREARLEWAPDFVAAAAAGDMGYSYGKFRYSAISPEGEPVAAEGVFHTVWRRQADGSWKFVYD